MRLRYFGICDFKAKCNNWILNANGDCSQKIDCDRQPFFSWRVYINESSFQGVTNNEQTGCRKVCDGIFETDFWFCAKTLQ